MRFLPARPMALLSSMDRAQNQMCIRDRHLYRRLLGTLRPDLAIGYTIKPNIYAAFVCRLLKIPYAANVTGLGSAFQNEGLLKKLVTAMYKVSLKKAKVVFFENCEDMQVFINSRIVKAGKACVLNGAGVDLEHFHPEDYPAGEKTRFLFIGRIMKEKEMCIRDRCCLNIFQRAAANVPNCLDFLRPIR